MAKKSKINLLNALKSNRKSKGGKAPQSSRLRVESLESRELLAVSLGEYAAIREAYPDFNLPEAQADINTIEIDSASLTLESLREAIAAAGTTTENDLIVVRTAENANTISFTAGDSALDFDIDASIYGSVTLVGLGDYKLTFDRAEGANSGTVSVAAGTEANFGGLTFAGTRLEVNGSAETIDSTRVNVGDSSFLNATLFGGNANIVVSDSRFTDNGNGGVVTFTQAGNLTLNNSIVENNQGQTIFNVHDLLSDVSTGPTLNLTLNDTIVRNNSTSTYGAVLYTGAGAVTINNSEFSNNSSAGQSGGALTLRSNGELTTTINGSMFDGNSVNRNGHGGAICLSDHTSACSKIINITDSIFSNNVAGVGAGVMAQGTTSARVSGSSFTGNSGGYATALVISNSSSTNTETVTIEDSVFSDNTSSTLWTSVYFYNLDELNVSNTRITGNNDGGIDFTANRATFVNNVIADNGGFGASGQATFINNTIVNNGGAGISAGSTLYNSIVAFSGNGDVNSSGATSAVVTAYNTLFTSEIWDQGENNYVYDTSKPLFTDAENGDYTLAYGSQALDCGDNDCVTATDLAGNARISNGVVDLGAYEFQVSDPSTEEAVLDEAFAELFVEDFDDLF